MSEQRFFNMRHLVDDYLDRRLSRRGFMKSMARWGFSTAAVSSVLDSLAPLAHAESGESGGSVRGELSGAVGVEGTGGDLLVAQLHAAGVRFVFNCNSSGTYPVFDALVDRPDMHVIQAPQEGQTVAIAQGYALGSGEVAFTLNGSVGFPNTLNNMYNAWKDRTPLVIASQRESTRVHGGRDAFEEWDDYLSPSASFTRWRWSVDRSERIPEITRRAFKIAATPPQGPVTLAFPADVLERKGARADVLAREKFIIEPRITPDAGLIQDAAKLLVEASSPLLVVGSEVTRSRAVLEVVALAERLAIPVVQGETLFDDFPTDHDLFAGQQAWEMRHPKSVDLILNLGARMADGQIKTPAGVSVVHVSIDPDAIGNVVPADVGIVADAKEAAADLLAAVEAMATAARLEKLSASRREAAKAFADGERARRAATARERWNDAPLSWERVGAELEALLDFDAIIVPELAQTSWEEFHENSALVQLRFGPGGKSKIGRTTGSALGWGIGAAIGVKLAQPDRQVVALQGDGGFMFAQAETLWTMARYEVPVIVVVFNNRSYNGPRNKVLREDGRQAQTGKDMICYLGSPDVDFAKVAAGFGVAGEVVSAPEQVRPAIERAIASTRDGKPYLIDAVVARTGKGAESTWYPKYSVAGVRSRKT